MVKILQGKEVAIIGAGFTGLVAAYRLAQKGARVTVYEHHAQIGGLVRGHTLKNGAEIERAYHFLYKTDVHILELAEELGVRNKLHFYKSSIGAFYRGALYPFMTPLDLLRFKPLSFFDRIRTGFVGVYLQSVRKWEKLTNVTAIEWLTRYNGKKATKILWEPLLKGKFHSYYDKVTMAWLWTRIKVRQDSKDKGETTEKLGYFEGSFNDVITALENKLLELGVVIKTNAGVQSIDHNDQTNKTSVKPQTGKAKEYDGVICTTPSPVFARLIEKNQQVSKDYLAQLSSIDYLGAITMIITTPQKLSDYYWHQIHDEDAPFLVLLSLTALTGDVDRYAGNHVYYVGDYLPNDDELMAASDEEVQKKWLAGVKKLFPEFDQKLVDEVSVFRFKDAQHIVGTDYESKKPDYQSPLPKVYLANFSQIFPQDRGTNYAVRDGNDIAELLSKELSQ